MNTHYIWNALVEYPAHVTARGKQAGPGGRGVYDGEIVVTSPVCESDLKSIIAHGLATKRGQCDSNEITFLEFSYTAIACGGGRHTSGECQFRR